MNPLLLILLAGAAQVDITPTWWPVIVNCFFFERQVSESQAPIFSKALVLQQGDVKTAIVVVDSCMMPRELIDEAKRLAERATGIPANRQMISATHTHMAPAAMGCLGSRADERYARWLPAKIAESIIAANQRLKPARVGSAAVQDKDHTFVRRFLYRSDKKLADPFGNLSVHANMHPGYVNDNATLPAGPPDTWLTLLSLQSQDGKPLALLANYAMHYFNSKPISPDYFGEFAKQFQARIGADADFVTLLSQGTSGDLMWMDYAKPQLKDLTIEAYTQGLVDSAEKAYRSIAYEKKPALRMVEVEESFNRRTPNAERLAWARKLLTEMGDRIPKTQPEVYAQEQVFLDREPVRKLKLQAIQVGELGIATWPNEVFAVSGLKLRERTGFRHLMNITLANGAEGYIPPVEQHALGGYTTWPARSAALELSAEARVVRKLSQLLASLDPKRRPTPVRRTRNSWSMEDLEANPDFEIQGLHAFAVPGRTGQALYLANGSLRLKKAPAKFTLDYWIWPALTSKRWTQVRVVQTRNARRTFIDGAITAETLPQAGLVIENFEGAVDEIRLKP